jgi:radical SAM superfamily enzyme YgiQ (UPF0313 family)
MHRRVVLIQPKLGYFESYRNNPNLPLGLLSAAARLVERFEVVILDQRLDGNILKRIDACLDGNTLLFGFTAYSAGISNALELSAYIKKRSCIPIVWGGTHPTQAPSQTLEHPRIDFVVQGEGEQALLELADRLAGENGDFSAIQGLWYKSGGEFRHTPPGDLIDLDTLPPLPYPIIPLERYLLEYRGRKYINYQIGRGCPNRCTFCYNLVFNRGQFRTKSVEKVFDEIRWLRRRYRFDGVYFVDDNLFRLGKDRILAIADEMRRQGLCWAVQGAEISALKQYNEKEFSELHSAGLRRVTVGIESASPRMRRLMNKQESTDEIREVIGRFNRVPVIILCNYMINLPTETLEDLKLSISMIYELRRINRHVRNMPFYRYVPNIGTPLTRRFEKDFPLPVTLEEWGRFSWESAGGPAFAGYLKDPAFFKSLIISSLLSDRKVDDFFQNPLVHALSAVYRPVANFRLRNQYFKYNAERFVFDKLFNVFT